MGGSSTTQPTQKRTEPDGPRRQKKKERKAREQLFDVEEDEEEEEGEERRNERGSSKRHAKGRRGGGADSDSEDEDKDAGVWADNEAEAMLGPGDEAKASDFDQPCVCLSLTPPLGVNYSDSVCNTYCSDEREPLETWKIPRSPETRARGIFP